MGYHSKRLKRKMTLRRELEFLSNKKKKGTFREEDEDRSRGSIWKTGCESKRNQRMDFRNQ